eukprot:TRINITY_DN28521_c0_g1_i1.p1 TRINITY_DN28521_c0_g1~~TRINITY_DN28521_c0_g1_i1.p1  ORF type:complete len:261 (+),score=32.90 TRINITY_DN28521_c0_g1_i1:67-783(+)
MRSRLISKMFSAGTQRVQRRTASFEFSKGGLPDVIEDKQTQKDAAAFVEAKVYKEHHIKDEDFKFIVPENWVLTTQSSNGQMGEEISTYYAYPERPRDDQGFQRMGHAVTVTLSITSFRPPPDYEQLLIKQPHKYVFRHWMENCRKSFVSEDYQDFEIHYGFPCTPYSDEAHGSYAWSTSVFRSSIDIVTYWRFIVHPSFDRLFLINYQSTPDVLEDHLAQRWFGMNLIEKVETGPFI